MQASAHVYAKRSKMYLLWAGFAAILMAVSDILRGLEADTPMATKFCISFWHLILSVMTLTFYSCKGGSNFIYPW